MAGLVIQITLAVHALQTDTLLHQVLVDIQQPATREDLLELVLLQLVHTGSAGDNHCPDVHIVQCIGQPVEQYAVVGTDLPALRAIA